MNVATGAAKVTYDSFFRGGFFAVQHAGKGHRSGSDALLLAACLPEKARGTLVELGAGAGVASFAALTANPELSAVLVEIEPEVAALAEAGASLPENRHLAGRAKVLTADAMLTGDRRVLAGLGDNMADFVLMNPPYNHENQRASPDELRARAHAMGEGGLDPWMRTAAAVLKPGGMLCMIWRTERVADVIACAQGRFGALAILPLHAREGQSASRVVIRAIRASRAPLRIVPGVVLHDSANAMSAIADDLINGVRRLPFPD